MLAGAGADKVLTTDASGVATWQEAGGGWDGILPNYTTAQRNDLSPTEGQLIYNTDNLRTEYYTISGWSYTMGPRANGVLCASNPDCISGYCVEGICCDTICDGICYSCTAAEKGSGSDGTCGYISTGTQCAFCKACSSGSCTLVAAGTSGYGCTGTHYRCNASGECTAPCTSSFSCISRGYASCVDICADYCLCVGASSTVGSCSPLTFTTCAEGGWYCKCMHYLYNQSNVYILTCISVCFLPNTHPSTDEKKNKNRFFKRLLKKRPHRF